MVDPIQMGSFPINGPIELRLKLIDDFFLILFNWRSKINFQQIKVVSEDICLICQCQRSSIFRCVNWNK